MSERPDASVGRLFTAMFGDRAGAGPYTHTFTPTDPYAHEFDPQSDAEWQFADWWDENDAEAATFVTAGPPSSFSLTIEPDGYPEWTFHYDRPTGEQ